MVSNLFSADKLNYVVVLTRYYHEFIAIFQFVILELVNERFSICYPEYVVLPNTMAVWLTFAVIYLGFL